MKILTKKTKQQEISFWEVEELQAWESLSPVAQALLGELDSDLRRVLLLGMVLGKIDKDHFEKSEPLQLKQCAEDLLEIDRFYKDEGGLVGYYRMTCDLLHHQPADTEGESFLPPPVIDVRLLNNETRAFFWEGIFHLDKMGVMIPLGGAADRLSLVDKATKTELPAIRLNFLGVGLLGILIRDLQAVEFLYFRWLSKQVELPIAIMTSKVKENAMHLYAYCQDHQWFKRNPEHFFIFNQPLVPSFDRQGKWIMKGPCDPYLLPPGHGVIWKAAENSGALDWFAAQGKSHLLIRQINNPIAGTDRTIPTFLGVGHRLKRKFGIASIPRQTMTKEGINVLVVKKEGDQSRAFLSNIEYCELGKLEKVDLESLYPANTNLLFLEIASLRQALKKRPYPGLILNFKKTESSYCSEFARVESMMQNISELFSSPHESFITLSERQKTMSVAKKCYTTGEPIIETPLGSYFDYYRNGMELLSKWCNMKIPAPFEESRFLQKGPSLFFVYHPALGPLYEIIAQKVIGGACTLFSELQLEISDLRYHNVQLDGSLRIVAHSPMGQNGGYSNRTGRAILDNVRIVNQGVKKSSLHTVWENRIVRKESLYIELQGYSEFVAKDLVFSGDFHIVVEDGVRLTAYQDGKDVIFKKELLPLEAAPFYTLSLTSAFEAKLTYHERPVLSLSS